MTLRNTRLALTFEFAHIRARPVLVEVVDTRHSDALAAKDHLCPTCKRLASEETTRDGGTGSPSTKAQADLNAGSSPFRACSFPMIALKSLFSSSSTMARY